MIRLSEREGENINITNIKFGELYSGKNEKKILYVSTKNFLAYYEWNPDEKGIDELDNNIPCQYIFQKICVHEGCLFVKNNSLLCASSDNKYIYEYSNCKLNKIEKDDKEKGKRNGELPFEGEKKSVMYYNNNFSDYIVYQIPGKTFSTIQVYDNINNFFVYIKSYSKKII